MLIFFFFCSIINKMGIGTERIDLIMKKKNIILIAAGAAVVVAGIVTAVVISKSGQKSITFEVTYKDETNDTITVKSKKDTLFDVLKEAKLIEYQEEEDGICVVSFNHNDINPDEGEAWSFAKDGTEIADISAAAVADKDIYEVKYVLSEAAVTNESQSEFAKKYLYSDTRPIAVMIDNDSKDARPQIGLDEAYLVYEITVEGGATRFMAVFKNDDTEKIGPVRSSRHYFLDYVMENNAIYTHYGWSPKAQEDIPRLDINNINGVAGDGNVFWRDYSVTKDWHTAYTSMANIKNAAQNKGYSMTSDKGNVFKYNDDDTDLPTETSATNISLKYNGIYTTGYRYDAEAKMYQKIINGSDYYMQNKSPVTAKNIIIQFAANYSLGDGSARQEVETVGSGSGYYITNGKCEKITWEKPVRAEKTKYIGEDGEEIVLNQGKTFVNIINPSNNVTVE